MGGPYEYCTEICTNEAEVESCMTGCLNIKGKRGDGNRTKDFNCLCKYLFFKSEGTLMFAYHSSRFSEYLKCSQF